MAKINVFRGWFLGFCLVCGLILFTSNPVQAQAILYDNLGDWQSAILPGSEELFATNWTNVSSANEVSTSTPTNAQLGATLTFDMSNTGLSRSFAVNTVEAGAGFTFNETEGTPSDLSGFQEALSVGDINNYENDDWHFSILAGDFITAFGVDLREVFSTATASITLKAGTEVVDVFSLNDFLPRTADDAYFLGITSSVPFDTLEYDHLLNGDDLALADFRLGAVVIPEPASCLLFLTGLSGLGILRRHRKKEM